MYSERQLRNLEVHLGNDVFTDAAIQGVVARLIEQAQLANEMGELLSEIEWSGTTYDCVCPSCKWYRRDGLAEYEDSLGHRKGCKLSGALAKWQG